MMTKKEKKRVPELRFEGFEGEWEVSKLKKIFSRSTKKNTINITEVLTNSASQGIVSQGSYFDRDIANSQNLKNYYVVEIDDFVYNPRISNLAPVGPLKRNKLYRGVMSPLYTVLNPIKGDLNFLEYFFESTCWHKYMRLVANYGARFDRMNITIGDFENLPVKHPSLSEQQKIATFLTSIDTRIHQLEKKKTLLEQYKKGVMQQLFSQEIRFRRDDGEEFGEWEERRIGDISTFFSGGTPRSTNRSFYNGNIPFIGSGNISDESVDSYITTEALNSSSAKLVKKGDLLYALYGATSGEVAISKINGAINQAVLCIRTKANKHYLYQLLKYNKDKIVETYIQGGQGNLSAAIIKDLKFKLPCLEEQTKIAHFLSSLDTKIAVVEEQMEKTKEWKKGLLQRMFV